MMKIIEWLLSLFNAVAAVLGFKSEAEPVPVDDDGVLVPESTDEEVTEDDIDVVSVDEDEPVVLEEVSDAEGDQPPADWDAFEEEAEHGDLDGVEVVYEEGEEA